MAEMLIKNGDYVRDGEGGAVMLEGKDEILQRVLFLLTARRGAFPFMADTGSRLHMLSGTAPGERQSAAEQYVAEALSNEKDIVVRNVTLADAGSGMTSVTVSAEYGGDDVSAALTVQ